MIILFNVFVHFDTFDLRFISINFEGFKWFEVTSGGVQCAQRGAISWQNVQGAAQAGAWNG